MKSRRTPSKWKLPLAGTMSLLACFAAYLFLLVPILEGQSAAGIPKVDPLGIFKSENTGQWISLFPLQSWQRDENQRNIVQADGNILVFQDYHQQSDGTLKVSRLCLLLFDQKNQSADGTYDLNGRDYPTVVEAIDGAVLTFDGSGGLAMGKYGQLLNIQFLGEVRFWKQSSDPQKQMALHTRQLVITGQNATTSQPVQFQFGDSIGQADGLELVFENPDLQQTMHPALTRIEGIALARFGRIRHLEFQLPTKEADSAKASRASMQPQSHAVELKCAGRAEFLFDQHVANFHNLVEVTDMKRGYRMNGHFLQVQFSADQSPTESSDKASEFLPKGLKARQIIAQGNPTTGQAVLVSELKSETKIEAAQLTYDLLDRLMVATTEIPEKPSQLFPDFVRLSSDDMVVEVPNLRYRGVENQDQLGPKKLGEIWAQGAGRLTRQSNQGPLQVTWTDQVTVLDDREMPDRKVVSFYGNARAQDEQDFDIQADQIHFWLRQLATLDGRNRHAPDLILAQDNVLFQTNDLYGQVQQARVYFPQDAPQPLPLSSRTLHTNRPDLGTRTQDRVLVARPRLDIEREEAPAAATRETLPWVQADQLILALDHAAQPDGQTSNHDDSQRPSTKYEPRQLELKGGVSVIESQWVNQTIQPMPQPEYTLKGEDISGQHQGKNDQGKAQFLWKITGKDKHDATIETPKGYFQSPEVHLDQAGNRVWSKKMGLLRFPMEMSGQLLGAPAAEETETDDSTGQGTLRWTQQMNFDGKSFFAEGDIRCDIEQSSPKATRRIQGNADKIQLELDRKIPFENQKSGRPPELLNLKLESTEPTIRPVRLFQQEFNPQGQLTSQDVIWSPRVQIDRQSDKVNIAGQGKLWSVRKGRPKQNPVQQVAHQESLLDYIEVEFDQAMVGDLEAGQFTFHGPVRSIHGNATQWQIKNPYQDLIDLIQLDSNTLILNRWRLNKESDYEMEMEASGSVHVVGTQFESLAERLRYNKRQDLLTIEGDTRNAARFWQDNPHTGKRNQAIAQKIWYYPKSRRFNLEGLKGGDLTFTAGATSPPPTSR